MSQPRIAQDGVADLVGYLFNAFGHHEWRPEELRRIRPQIEAALPALRRLCEAVRANPPADPTPWYFM